MVRVKKAIHKFFQGSVILKGIDGILELIGGILLLLISKSAIMQITKLFLRIELIEDPKDLIANLILNLISGMPLNIQLFSALYLIIHRVIKVGLVFALLYKKLWAYPLSEIVFALFAISQLYAYYFSHSILLLILTFLDILVIILVWIEYKNRICLAKTKVLY